MALGATGVSQYTSDKHLSCVPLKYALRYFYANSNSFTFQVISSLLDYCQLGSSLVLCCAVRYPTTTSGILFSACCN